VNSLNQKVGHLFFLLGFKFELKKQINFSAVICLHGCYLQCNCAYLLLDGMWHAAQWCWSVAYAMHGRRSATDLVYATWIIPTFGKSTNRL